MEEIKIQKGIWEWLRNEWFLLIIVCAFLTSVVYPIWQIRLEIAVMKEQVNQITSYEPRITKLEEKTINNSERITILESTCISK